MNRWTGSWLSGPSAALDPEGRRAVAEAENQRWRGDRLGLPETGPGSVARPRRKLAALLVDLIMAALVAGLFTAPELPRNWSLLAWVLLTVVPVAVAGFTPGMALLGIRVARLGGAVRVGLPRAAARTVMIFFLIPAVVWDLDYRGLHDRTLGTVVVNTR
ncbi:RDD family protein [Actinoalloteichus spitiensis]|uniref:RDD family protein n=1 Tax=Actinoalloteichus spitiensis TaxID=252394 RepID=UPI00036FCEED|nr:RDD family protein [Actinoalloteichus spitiensis]